MDAKAWDQRYTSAKLIWSTSPNHAVATELAGLPPGRALDLACGEGRNAIWLAGRGWQVTAVDFSTVAVSKARQLARTAPGGTSVAWSVADALSFEPDTGVELVLLAYLHLAEAERRQVVRRAFGSLRPGGTFLLVAHDSTNLLEGTGGPQDASVLYTAEQILGDLAGESFEVLRAERIARVVSVGTMGHEHHGEPAATAWDALVRLVRTDNCGPARHSLLNMQP